jgi:hypothetical protein
MITGTNKWYTVAAALRDAVVAGLSTPVERSCLVPGEIAWDGCTCGALYVGHGLLYLSDRFPEQRGTVEGPCDSPFEVQTMIFALMRCAPNPSGQSMEVPCTELDPSALQVRVDAQELLNAVSHKLCEMVDVDIMDFIIDTQETKGPGGGCVGTELRIRVGLLRG